MSISVADWGVVDGVPVQLWTLIGTTGMRMRVTNYGTIITELHVPGRDGALVDVALGRPSLQDYVERTQYFGCSAGRCANRICKGQFSIDGVQFQATVNNGQNCLHGGAKGFDKVVWNAKGGVEDEMPRVVFEYTSKHGEEGFPGTLHATVIYTLTPNNELRVDMSATTDASTIANFAHHTFWNLSGHGAGSVLDHELQIIASSYTPVDANLITTGEILPVAGTPFDFRQSKPIGRDIGLLHPAAGDPGGFDHNWCICSSCALRSLLLKTGVCNSAARCVDGTEGCMRPAALLRSPATGIAMLVSSNQAGIQFYSGNFLDGIPGKDGAMYHKHHGLCLETQAYPDSVNKQELPGWPKVVLRPNDRYHHCMLHAFSVD